MLVDVAVMVPAARLVPMVPVGKKAALKGNADLESVNLALFVPVDQPIPPSIEITCPVM